MRLSATMIQNLSDRNSGKKKDPGKEKLNKSKIKISGALFQEREKKVGMA